MTIQKIAKLVPALGIACMLSLPAMAQTTTSGTMTPATPQTKAEKHKTHEHKKHEKHEHKKLKDMDNKADNAKSDHAKDKHAEKSVALPASEQFSSLSAATAHCPGSVEWATLGGSKVYHGSTSHYFGKTKHGVYACKAALNAAGFRPAKD